MQITQEALNEAYAEIEVLRQEKRARVGWPDEMFEFVTTAMGDSSNRRPDKITYTDVAKILDAKGWWPGCNKSALSQSYRLERKRRHKLTEGGIK